MFLARSTRTGSQCQGPGICLAGSADCLGRGTAPSPFPFCSEFASVHIKLAVRYSFDVPGKHVPGSILFLMSVDGSMALRCTMSRRPSLLMTPLQDLSKAPARQQRRSPTSPPPLRLGEHLSASTCFLERVPGAAHPCCSSATPPLHVAPNIPLDS